MKTTIDGSDQEAVRAIGKSCWAAIMKRAHPNLSKEQLAASWEEQKKEYVKIGRSVLSRLRKGGYTVSKL